MNKPEPSPAVTHTILSKGTSVEDQKKEIHGDQPKPHCCYTDDGNDCEKDAVWWSGKDARNATHACEEHLGQLVEDGDTIRAL